MSKYQFYGFRAIDRPLISSRAEITSQGLINVHNYGDLKAHPGDLLLRFLAEHGRRRALVNRLEKARLYRAGL